MIINDPSKLVQCVNVVVMSSAISSVRIQPLLPLITVTVSSHYSNIISYCAPVIIQTSAAAVEVEVAAAAGWLLLLLLLLLLLPVLTFPMMLMLLLVQISARLVRLYPFNYSKHVCTTSAANCHYHHSIFGVGGKAGGGREEEAGEIKGEEAETRRKLCEAGDAANFCISKEKASRLRRW